MAEHLFLEDNTGDKKYFTIIPNYIVNHSTAIDQALYLNMKRFSGELHSGLCFASEKTLMAKMGIGRKALHKSIKYLLDHKWITLYGTKTIETKGGLQKIKVYQVNDIWKMNVDYYEGVSKRAPLAQRGVQKGSQGVAERAPKKNKREEDNFFPLNEEDKEKYRKLHEDFKRSKGWIN